MIDSTSFSLKSKFTRIFPTHMTPDPSKERSYSTYCHRVLPTPLDKSFDQYSNGRPRSLTHIGTISYLSVLGSNKGIHLFKNKATKSNLHDPTKIDEAS